jgi:hypothetical protein
MTRFSRTILALGALLMVSGAQGMLIDRGGGFIYDDVLGITWIQNANINGLDTWHNQRAWAAGLSIYDSVRDVTWDDWRLPMTTQPDPSCSTQHDPGGGFPLQGFGFGCTGSEMGHLSIVDGVSAGTPGLFTNVQHDRYWSGTAYAPGSNAWFFNIGNSTQTTTIKSSTYYAWAVRDGDVAAIPAPATVWLFGSAVGLLGWIRRRVS